MDGLNIYNIYQGKIPIFFFICRKFYYKTILVNDVSPNVLLLNFDFKNFNLKLYFLDCESSGSMQHFKSFLMNNFPDKIKNGIKANKKLKLTPTCTNDKLILDFMNNPDVQKAIHVTKTPLGSWTLCSNMIFNKYQKRTRSMSE